MAMNYQNFASLGVNLNRQKYGPLDISSVFTSAADLRYYLTKGAETEGVSEYWYKNANEKIVPYPYEGQVIATVINDDVKVYVLRLDAEGAFEAKAIEPEVDGKTIKLTNGKLELVGLPTDTSKVYVPSLVNGVLTWAEPDTSTAEGQQQAIDGLTSSVAGLSAIVNGKAASGEEGTEDYVAPVVGLVEKVAALEAVDNATQAELDAYKDVVTAAIAAGVKEAKDYADANDANTIYDDTALTGRVEALEAKPFDTYATKTEVQGVDAKFADYVKTTDLETYKEEVEETFADVYTKDDADAKFAIKGADAYDDEEVRGLISDNADAISAIEADYLKAADIADFETKENVKKVSDNLADYIESNNTAVAGVKATADAAAVKTEVEAALELKADKTALAETDATLAEVKKVVDDFFSEDAAIEGVVDTLKEIASYISTDKDGAADITSRVGVLEGKVDVEKVSTAISTAVAAETERATGIESGLDGRISALESTKDDYKTADAILKAELQKEIDDDVKVVSDALTKAKTDISAEIDSDVATAIAAEVTRSDAKAKELADAAASSAATALATAKSEIEEGIKEVADDLADYIEANDTALASVKATAEAAAVKSEVETALAGKVDNATLDNYYTSAEVEDKGYAVATEVAGTYATKTALTEAVEGIETDLNAYAKTADVNVELAKKIETGSIAHTSESDSEGVTVSGTQLNIVVDAYTKAETLASIEAKVEESATALTSALNTYKETNDSRVSTIETKNGEQDTAIAEAKAQADKGVADAAKVAGDLVTANQLIADNTREIGVAKSSIETVNTTLTEKITALENADTTIKSDITTLQGITTGEGGHAARIAGLESRATNLEAKDTELATLIQGNTDKFANYYTATQVDDKVKEVSDAVNTIDLEPYAKVVDVDADILAVNNELALKANIADVYSKTDADAKFMTEAQVKSTIDKVVADVSSTDTIEGLVTLVNYVHDNAGDIAELVATVENNGKAITKNTQDISKNAEDIVAINNAIAAIIQPKASTEISVGTDGTLGVIGVSTDKLVQGNDILVLDGGSAK